MGTLEVELLSKVGFHVLPVGGLLLEPGLNLVGDSQTLFRSKGVKHHNSRYSTIKDATWVKNKKKTRKNEKSIDINR